MKRVMRWLGLTILSVAGLAALGLSYLFLAYPAVGDAPAIEVKPDPKLLARGTYLAEHVAVCVDCHSERDFGRFSGPIKPHSKGKGGDRFGPELGLPGTLIPPNITPFALSSWSDGELIRAITTGVTPDGRALFPLMPWQSYAKLCDEDLAALVTYVRSLAPIESTPERSSLDFPVNLIARTLPTPRSPVMACPDPNDSVARGQYLVRTAGCADCHTPRNDKGEPLPGLAFSGGVAIPLPSGGVVRSANLTPDEGSGLGGWTRERFVERFAYYRDASHAPAVERNSYNTIMPWTMYAGMTDADLGAIYDYLRTLEPVARPQTERFAVR